MFILSDDAAYDYKVQLFTEHKGKNQARALLNQLTPQETVVDMLNMMRGKSVTVPEERVLPEFREDMRQWDCPYFDFDGENYTFPDVYHNPFATYLCVNSKDGVFPAELYKVLFESLRWCFPDDEERSLWILMHSIVVVTAFYGMCEGNLEHIADDESRAVLRADGISAAITRKVLYQSELVEGNVLVAPHESKVFKHQQLYLLNYMEEMKRSGMKFDVVMGNPPYNNDIYLDFVQAGHAMARTYSCWITPAKFVGKMDTANLNFRRQLMPFISDLTLYIHTHEVFSILSDGGIAYFLCQHQPLNRVNVTNICNDVPRLVPSYALLKSQKDISRYSLLNVSDSIVEKVYQGGFVAYIPRQAAESDWNFYLTAQFGGSGAPTNRFFDIDGQALVLSKYEIVKLGETPASRTTMRMFSASTEGACERYLSWVYSKFVRFLLICGMCQRSSVAQECWRFVPDPGTFDRIFEDAPDPAYYTRQNGTYIDSSGVQIPANGEYLDSNGSRHCSLYAKYALTDDEINIIESVIRKREPKK